MWASGGGGPEGCGQKGRGWNSTALWQEWGVAWADDVNERLAELDIDARKDHRTLEAQGIDLEPQHKIGPAATATTGFTGMDLFWCMMIGLVVTGLIVWITEYYTGTNYPPVRSITKASKTGHGPHARPAERRAGKGWGRPC